MTDLYAKAFGASFAYDWGAALAAPVHEELAKGAGVLLLLTLGCLAVFGAFFAYCLENVSGHTGFAPYGLLYFFVPLLVLGAAELIYDLRHRTPYRNAVLAVVTSTTSIAFLVFLDFGNMMLQYESWIKRIHRSPTEVPDLRSWLPAFAAIQLAAIVWFLWPKYRSSNSTTPGDP